MAQLTQNSYHLADALGILKKHFGYDGFRHGQEELIGELLQGHDVIGIMPTGAGKSICFQVPALLFSGITLVVSPLISLMKDQVRALTQAGIPAAYINSSLSFREMEDVLYDARRGVYKLIYVAPERLLTPSFLDFAQEVTISMVTVDEAHCISQWGQDFRPSYTQIPEFIAALPQRPVVSAFTATATRRVREDILALLQLNDPKVLVTGFDRENLFFEVQQPKGKKEALLRFVKERKGQSGIVYCLTRKNVEEVCEFLNQSGYLASRYHAGLPDMERRENQDHFLFDRIPIMVATNAFGMGIDKPNVSYVVHYNMPKDMESYYQEAGRGGRDGSPAHCLLLYSGQDVRTNQWMIDQDKEYEQEDPKIAAQLKARQEERLRQMAIYGTTTECLRSYILRYFGEHPAPTCTGCSHCTGSFTLVDVTVESQKVLSCVKRMGERYGATMVIGVLRGSKDQRILDMGLDLLTTYGISQQGEQFLRILIQYLTAQGYLVQSAGEYPTLALAPKAWTVLRGETTLTMRLYDQPEAKEKKPIPANRVEKGKEGLYQDLVVLRKSIASRQGVPPFVVFSDKTLVDFCDKMPSNDNQLLDVYGVGEQKAKRYGREFLRAIQEYIG